MPIIDLKDCLGIDTLPDDGEYHTLNGLIMQIIGKVPMTGEMITLDS